MYNTFKKIAKESTEYNPFNHKIKKKALNNQDLLRNGAQEGTRTPTPLTEPAPEAGASTNFATWATTISYLKSHQKSSTFSIPLFSF